jgi:hypothetical protein
MPMVVNTDNFREQWFTSVEVAIFLSLIFSYFCFLFPALRPCQGRLTVIKPCVNTYHKVRDETMNQVLLNNLPLKKYISTYPRDSMSSLRLCSMCSKTPMVIYQNERMQKGKRNLPGIQKLHASK